jgi:membrane protein YqaA with SNARE-associated domain
MKPKLTLNAKKETYLERVANQTSYPVLRGLISFLSNLLLLLAIVNFGIGLIGALYFREFNSILAIVSLLASTLISAVIYIIGRIIYEGISILIDIADSTLDLNSRYE